MGYQVASAPVKKTDHPLTTVKFHTSIRFILRVSHIYLSALFKLFYIDELHWLFSFIIFLDIVSLCHYMLRVYLKRKRCLWHPHLPWVHLGHSFHHLCSSFPICIPLNFITWHNVDDHKHINMLPQFLELQPPRPQQ